MGGSEKLSRQWKQNIKALSSQSWVTSVTASYKRLLCLKTLSSVWPGARCSRAAAGGSVDRKEMPEPLSSGKKTRDQFWFSVSLGFCFLGVRRNGSSVVPTLSLWYSTHYPSRHSSVAGLSWRTRNPGQTQQSTLLTQDYIQVAGSQPQGTAVRTHQLCLSFQYVHRRSLI